MLARDPYATLGVPPSAGVEDIEQAYRHLSRRYHPDINPGDPKSAAVFERIQHAYRVLSDPESRAQYDRHGKRSPAAPAGASEITVRLLPEAGEGGSYGELFRRLRAHSRRCATSRGEDIHVVVGVPLAQAERGRRLMVEVVRRQPCGTCGGRGRVQLQRRQPCRQCDASGREFFVKGALSISCACSDCGGEGSLSGAGCSDCHGSGLRSGRDRLLVRVPPGALSGQEIRVPRAGHAGSCGGESGDLIARVQIEPVPDFEREGPHLRCVVPLSVSEAVLGARIEIATLEGEPTSLRIPPLTQNGRVFRLRGRGLEMPDGRRGDMLVRAEIHIPELVDEDSKELMRKFGARNPSAPRLRQASARSRS